MGHCLGKHGVSETVIFLLGFGKTGYFFKECNMKLSSLFSAIFTLATVSVMALEITPDYPIVKGNLHGAPAEYSAVVLADHLEKIFGKRPAVISRSEYDGKTPAILLDEEKGLQDEEWRIRVSGKNLRISGGHPRGVFYGSCEFLEKFAGVRWFTAFHFRIPKATRISVPDNREFCRKPAFPLKRAQATSFDGKPYDYANVLNKDSANSADSSWPSLFESRGIGGPHNFYRLTKDLPQDMERLLPVDEHGRHVRAVTGMGPGQVCYANPEFRTYAKRKVGEWIEEQKKFIKEHNMEEGTWLRWIEISQNDNTSHCQCAGCRAMIEKYASISGAQLEFINDIASAYPDYTFVTFAYQRTMTAPKNIRARDNVMIQFAFLTDGSRFFDTLRPISHPANRELSTLFESWRGISNHKAVWCYHRLYPMTESFVWPQCFFWYIGEDMRFYHRFGATKMFVEAEYCVEDGLHPRAFHDLHAYLTFKMMDDPYQDDKKLITEFFDFQYGPAAPEMREYAAYLKKRIDAFPGAFPSTPLKSRNLLDEAFFRNVNSFLARAEAKLANDPVRFENVVIERIPVDFAALNVWDAAAAGSGLPRKAVCDRLEKNIRLAYNRYLSEGKSRIPEARLKTMLENDMKRVETLRNPIPAPPGMEGKDILQISAAEKYPGESVADPEAVYGKAVKYGEVRNAGISEHEKPMEFGVYNSYTKKIELKKVISPDTVPNDEAYHLIYVGRVRRRGDQKQILWAHWTWKMRIDRFLDPLWNQADPNREYDLYISCKQTGPAYVPGSKRENAVYVDKIVAVKATGLSEPLPVPAGMETKELTQVAVAGTELTGSAVCDPDAAYGKTLKLGKIKDPAYDHGKRPMAFGIYDYAAKQHQLRRKLAPEEIAKDEKYHLIRLGTFVPDGTGKQHFWGHESWGLNLKALIAPLSKGIEYELYISCKLTGPVYVPDSKSENAVWVDKIVAVKTGKTL